LFILTKIEQKLKKCFFFKKMKKYSMFFPEISSKNLFCVFDFGVIFVEISSHIFLLCCFLGYSAPKTLLLVYVEISIPTIYFVWFSDKFSSKNIEIDAFFAGRSSGLLLCFLIIKF
jgi:hypothetical protein